MHMKEPQKGQTGARGGLGGMIEMLTGVMSSLFLSRLANAVVARNSVNNCHELGESRPERGVVCVGHQAREDFSCFCRYFF